MSGPRLVVYESSDPLLTLRLKKRLPDFGGTAPYLLTGVTQITFAVKADPDDTSVKFDYTLGAEITITDDGSGVSDRHSEITIQCAAADLTPPGVYYWHLTALKASKLDGIGDGFFEVKNI